MLKRQIACLVVILPLAGLAGCSSLTKRTKAKGATESAVPGPLLSSSRKVQQDLRQTESDLGELESQVRSYK